MKHLLACLLALPAAADEVVLRNGARFSGVVTREAGRVHVRLDAGELSFAAVDVASVRLDESDPFNEAERRAMEASTAQACHEAAVFAAEKGLPQKAQELHLRAVALDPDHEGSRRALNHVKHQGRWLPFEDLMGELGYVKEGEDWIPRAERERRQEAARAEVLAQAEAEREASRQDHARALELEQIDRERKLAEERHKRELYLRRLELLRPPPPVVVLPPYAPPFPHERRDRPAGPPPPDPRRIQPGVPPPARVPCQEGPFLRVSR